MRKKIRKTIGDNIPGGYSRTLLSESSTGVVEVIKWIFIAVIAAVLIIFGVINREKICKWFCSKLKKSKPDKRNAKNSSVVPVSKEDAYQFMELLEALDELNHSK